MFNHIKEWWINDSKKKWFKRYKSVEWFLTPRILPNSFRGFLLFIGVILLTSFFAVNLNEPVTNRLGETFNIIATIVVVWIGIIVGANNS